MVRILFSLNQLTLEREKTESRDGSLWAKRSRISQHQIQSMQSSPKKIGSYFPWLKQDKTGLTCRLNFRSRPLVRPMNRGEDEAASVGGSAGIRPRHSR